MDVHTAGNLELLLADDMWPVLLMPPRHAHCFEHNNSVVPPIPAIFQSEATEGLLVYIYGMETNY